MQSVGEKVILFDAPKFGARAVVQWLNRITSCAYNVMPILGLKKEPAYCEKPCEVSSGLCSRLSSKSDLVGERYVWKLSRFDRSQSLQDISCSDLHEEKEALPLGKRSMSSPHLACQSAGRNTEGFEDCYPSQSGSSIRPISWEMRDLVKLIYDANSENILFLSDGSSREAFNGNIRRAKAENISEVLEDVGIKGRRFVKTDIEDFSTSPDGLKTVDYHYFDNRSIAKKSLGDKVFDVARFMDGFKEGVDFIYLGNGLCVCDLFKESARFYKASLWKRCLLSLQSLLFPRPLKTCCGIDPSMDSIEIFISNLVSLLSSYRDPSCNKAKKPMILLRHYNFMPYEKQRLSMFKEIVDRFNSSENRGFEMALREGRYENSTYSTYLEIRVFKK